MTTRIIATLAGALALSALLAGCAAQPSEAPARSAPPAEETQPASADWVGKDLTMEAGADLPDGLETIVTNSFTGAEGWEPMESTNSYLTSYQQTSTQCVATHGIVELERGSDVGDLQASSDFLGKLQGSDISDVEPTIFGLPFVSEVTIGDVDPSGLPDIEMAGYPAEGDRGVTLWAARAIEKVGKGFVFALTCTDLAVFEITLPEAKNLIAFGVYDPSSMGVSN